MGGDGISSRGRQWAIESWAERKGRESGAQRAPQGTRQPARPRHCCIHRAQPTLVASAAAQASPMSCTPLASHSLSFVQRLRLRWFLTASARAFFWPTSTTSRLPRVMAV